MKILSLMQRFVFCAVFLSTVITFVLGKESSVKEMNGPRSDRKEKVIADIVYNSQAGQRGMGDLYLPRGWNSSTPLALLIHGGGWSAMDRRGVQGIAEFLCENGFAVFNVNYRLLAAGPWPLCGDDCLTAARFALTTDHPDFRRISQKRLLVIGGSAGGHLALMTGLRLPTENVSGIVSISGIADIPSDRAASPGRYSRFFKKVPSDKEILMASPMGYIKKQQPPILCTHTVYDKVVPIESALKFYQASKKAGARIEFYQYERKNDGHCIWIPGSNPHRLYPDIEEAIDRFIDQYDCKK